MKKLIVTFAAALLMTAPAIAQQAAPAAKPTAPAAAAPAAAGSVAGKWTGESAGQAGPMKMDLEIKVVAGKVEGTMSMGPMGVLPLKDGTVAGTKVSFVTELNYQGTPLSIKYSGEMKGDKLTLAREIPGMDTGGQTPPVEFTRAK